MPVLPVRVASCQLYQAILILAFHALDPVRDRVAILTA